MFDPAQLLLFIVILVLTILLVVLGVQVYLILRDLRHTITKANKVLDRAGEITENVSAPISNLSSLIMGLRTGATFANLLKKVSDDKPIRPASQRGEQAQDKEEKHGE